LRHLLLRSTTGLLKPFARAVETLGSISGRVIVTGVGKSGHIGAKIAATMASTGTPAHFVHPAEANHGDLGMIARDDAIIVLSWSGESAELKGILAYSRRFGIPLIAFTAGADSALGREADIVLLLPREQEACPHGLAPTTSTLMQLALGDALAVALLEAKGLPRAISTRSIRAASSVRRWRMSPMSCTQAIRFRWFRREHRLQRRS
jgi:arabinose-5-phosphate isomerase